MKRFTAEQGTARCNPLVKLRELFYISNNLPLKTCYRRKEGRNIYLPGPACYWSQVHPYDIHYPTLLGFICVGAEWGLLVFYLQRRLKGKYPAFIWDLEFLRLQDVLIMSNYHSSSFKAVVLS